MESTKFANGGNKKKRNKEANRKKHAESRRPKETEMERVYKKRSPCTFAGAVLLNQLTKSKFL